MIAGLSGMIGTLLLGPRHGVFETEVSYLKQLKQKRLKKQKKLLIKKAKDLK